MSQPSSITPQGNSLVISVFNGAETLERTLVSVAAQSHALDEVVIVNDGSTDATSEIIAAWESHLPLVQIHNPRNLGIVRSLQNGTDYASGELVFRLDADDVWLPNHVESMVKLRKRYPNAALYASRSFICTADQKHEKKSTHVDENIIRSKLLWNNPLVHSSVAFDKQAYETVGGYLGPRYAEDYSLWIRLLSKGSFAFTEKITVVYYDRENSFSKIKRAKAQCVRFGLQRLAIRAFAVRHPIVAALITPVLLLRQVLNKVNIG